VQPAQEQLVHRLRHPGGELRGQGQADPLRLRQGVRAGEEVVQLYLTDEKATTPRPVRQLEGFRRIMLQPGETKEVEFTLELRQFSIINNRDKRVIEPGYFTISVGGKQPGFKGYLDPQFTQVLTGRINLTGKEFPFAN